MAVRNSNPQKDNPGFLDVFFRAFSEEAGESLPKMLGGDIPFGLLDVDEHGGTVIDVALLPERSVIPGSTVTIQITPQRNGTPVTNAAVSATYARFPRLKEPLPLVDDGSGGDETAGDGTFTAQVTNEAEGRYEIEIWARAEVDGKPAVNRYSRSDFTVRSYSDLAIEPDGIQIGATDSDSVFAVNATFRNTGCGPVEYVYVTFLDNETHLPFDRVVQENVQAGQQVTVSTTWRPLPPSPHDPPTRARGVTVELGPISSRLEHNHENNRASATLPQ